MAVVALTGRGPHRVQADWTQYQTQVEQEFFRGYEDGQGYVDESEIWQVIWCESNWLIDPGNAYIYYGLGQFAHSTWENLGGGDWQNPYLQGIHFAVLLNTVGKGQWGCFR